MNDTRSPAAHMVSRLRSGADVDATSADVQQRYEAWARRETWHLRYDAVPLVVGHDPSSWPAYVEANDCATLADELSRELARDLGVDEGAHIMPLAIRRWAQDTEVRLPVALSRLLDFIASVLPQGGPGDMAASEVELLRAQERETLLGAALMLVTRDQAACRDEDGCYSPAIIARLILARALLWFPLAPPTLDEAAIAALVARWITPSGAPIANAGGAGGI